MVEMSDREYEESGLLGLVIFVIRAPFEKPLRRRSLSSWLLAVPVAVLYEVFAIPLVVGSVVVLLVLMTPMVLIAAAMQLLRMALRR